MRIYVLITQVRPLKLYLFQEGIVRFSSDRYDTSSLKNVYSHLTNSSINKHAPSNVSNLDGSGLKWTFDQLRSYFMHNGMGWDLTWSKIETIIRLTCINLCSLVPDLKCCFELLGFDIMLDQNLKPWLLEVNSSPAMSMDNQVDYAVKPQLLRDVIKLNDFEPYEEYLRRTAKKPTKNNNINSNFFAKRTGAVAIKKKAIDEVSQSHEVTMARRAVAVSQYARPARKLDSEEVASTTSFKPRRKGGINGIKLERLNTNATRAMDKLARGEPLSAADP